ncbi:MAG TPA: hypothetical protein VJB63_04005 [Patescibacteria group bacterium]|nr:hypothetical protein [Patescibacteria group bacterium]
MKFHFYNVQDLSGFAAENAKGGEPVKILTRALLTSDNLEFYQYSESFSNIFFNKSRIQVDGVYQFLVIIHQDLSADLYVNDFGVLVEIRAKRDIKAGYVYQGDIADIRKVKFQDIEIVDTDKVIYCFKVGWRFGLFFDFTSRSQPVGTAQPIATEKLDIEKMELSIGDLRRYLSFYHVYKVLESETQFVEMMKDGWFPFVEILAGVYKKLSEAYQSKFDFENKIKAIVDSFNDERIKKITEKWWKNQIFSDKKSLIEAGVNAYLQNNQDGFVNCIKNLWTEIDGILRKLYHSETGKGDGVKSSDLISHIVEKAKTKSVSDHSLLLPLPFLKYLQDVVFANFNVETGSVDMSRNASSHGVAEPDQYTKDRALQVILVLDQIYFYS